MGFEVCLSSLLVLYLVASVHINAIYHGKVQSLGEVNTLIIANS